MPHPGEEYADGIRSHEAFQIGQDVLMQWAVTVSGEVCALLL